MPPLCVKLFRQRPGAEGCRTTRLIKILLKGKTLSKNLIKRMTWGAMDTAGLGLDIRFHRRISTKSSLPFFLPLVQAQAAIGRASGPGRPIAPIPFQLQFLYQFGNRNRPYYLCSVQLVHKPPCSFSRSVTHQDRSNCWADLVEQENRTSFPGRTGGFRRWHCSKG